MFQKVFPFVGWFKGYSTACMRSDMIAGFTVALVLVPQSMAYAQLAGLPPLLELPTDHRMFSPEVYVEAIKAA